MRALRLIPDETKIDFLRFRFLGFAISGLLLLATLAALSLQGLNLGIDFLGGILIEARAERPIDLAELRAELQGLQLGEVKLQTVDAPTDVLIRIQEPRGGLGHQQVALRVQEALDGYSIRRVEVVGPTIGSELFAKGVWATALSLVGITVYLALRFDWQFAIAALLTTFHDVLVTVGLYSIAGLEFNLTSIAALLTLAGYSINDTVVIFDRIRETIRRKKRGDLLAIINESVNRTLTRTVNTSLTTLLAVLALVLFAGPALRGFGIALTFGIVVGTFSSVFVAAALLPVMMPRGLPKGADGSEPAAEH